MRLAILSLALLALLPPAAPRAGVTIRCIDVGQGDATLVESSSGLTLLFDGGDNGKGNNVINPYLAGRGISEITYMIASHYHADHVGGLDEVYNGTGVTTACYDRGWSYTTQTYQGYANAVASKRQTLTDGQVIDLGDDVLVRCVAINGNGVLSSPFSQPPHDENDLCIALLVTCGEFDFFVAGDLGGQNTSSYADIETSLGPEVGDIEVYRVDHHGSQYASNATFLAALAPEVSIISVGTNSYGHPNLSTINRLVAADSYIYQTELGSGGTIPAGAGRVVSGHVVIETDGVFSFTVAGDVYTLGSSDCCPQDPVPLPMLSLDIAPNPCNTAATVRYRTPEPRQPGWIVLHDLSGRQLRRWQVSGSGELTWDGKDASGVDLADGVYFVRWFGPEGAPAKRLLVVR
ncbi:MAG: MBL fold metallo-hydrolase [Candidatus Eisenbacteria bacterium]